MPVGFRFEINYNFTARQFVATGVDAALAHALLVAPLARGPKDEDALLSLPVSGVVQLLQVGWRSVLYSLVPLSLIHI